MRGIECLRGRVGAEGDPCRDGVFDLCRGNFEGDTPDGVECMVRIACREDKLLGGQTAYETGTLLRTVTETDKVRIRTG